MSMSTAVPDVEDDNASLAESSLSSATTSGSSYVSERPTMDTDSDWDDLISPRVHIDETEEVYVYEPAPGVVREETHRKRRRHITVRRTRKGHIHFYERPISRLSCLLCAPALTLARSRLFLDNNTLLRNRVFPHLPNPTIYPLLDRQRNSMTATYIPRYITTIHSLVINPHSFPSPSLHKR